MKTWFIVHSLESFGQNPRMIGFAAKTKLDGSPVRDSDGDPIPAIGKIREIKPGDRIVYYCKGDSVIKGIYEIVHEYYAKESQWPDSPFQFEIRPIIELEEPYDFRPLVSSLDLFKGVTDIRHWGPNLQGITNSIKPLTSHDYQLIEKSISQARKEIEEEKEEEKAQIQDYRQHLLIQYEIAEWGLKNGYRVHVAVNDRSKIRQRLPGIMDEIPRFHRDDVIDIAKRIDVTFFDKERDILTHLFEIEHTPIIYSGLLRLNDIAECYPSENVKFYIVSSGDNREKFEREVERPSFYLLRKHTCRFIDYDQVSEEWKDLQKRKPPIF